MVQVETIQTGSCREKGGFPTRVLKEGTIGGREEGRENGYKMEETGSCIGKRTGITKVVEHEKSGGFFQQGGINPTLRGQTLVGSRGSLVDDQRGVYVCYRDVRGSAVWIRRVTSNKKGL